MNIRVIYCFLIALFSSNSLIINAQQLNDSLLIYYPFSGNATDQSGNGFDGIVNATPTADINGTPNEAFSFNGIDNYIDFPDTSKLKPELPISFSFWIRFEDLSPDNTVIVTNDFAQNSHSGVWMNLSSQGNINISYGNNGGNTSGPNLRSKKGLSTLQENQWYHIAGVIRGYNDMDIYLDCENDGGNYLGTASQLGYSSNPGSIGRKDASTIADSYYFKGQLDEFSFWNRALNSEDIQILCKSSSLQSESISSNINSNHFTLFPNPVESVLNIKSDKDLLVGNFKILNSFNQIVKQEEFENSIDVSGLSAGVYFIQFFNSNGELISVDRFVKK